ncbi:MAG TPA: preQ(1) synthase [Candidatus Omnitrophota bacterium]|nr:preQ(1) synthase [Candidatus Omnitrophota bacterium]
MKGGTVKKKSYDLLQEKIRSMKLPEIETWTNKYSDRDYKVSFSTEEFTCVCPKTGLPDFARIEIEYFPDKFCVELKSFKEYMMAYRDVGIFHEHVVNRMLTDLVKACSPRGMKIRGEFGTRGGITTAVEAVYDPEGSR